MDSAEHETGDDTPTTTDRRRALLLFGAGGLATIAAACTPSGGPAGGPPGGGGLPPTTIDDGNPCEPIPEETEGPFPGDGSNGPEVPTQPGVVRSDIRSSFGSSSTTAAGVPLRTTLTIVDTGTACGPAAGRAVYVWHCDQLGRYSMYSPGVTKENYLRGVQVTDANGQVTFDSIFPGCYSGRWPHIHFEVYPSLASITSARNKVATSQLAIPKPICDDVYATSGYTGSASNLSHITLATDMVFADGTTRETPSVTGDVTSGYQAFLTVPL